MSKEVLVYKTEFLLKSAMQEHLEEHEFLFSRSVYNKEGKPLSEIHYDGEGNVVQEYLHTYNDKGFLTEEILKEGDGEVADHKTFEYDDKGNIMIEKRHYSDGSFDTIHYHYNSLGKVQRKETIDPDDETEAIEEYEYENGLVTRYRVTDAQGEVLSEESFAYNEKGEPVEIIQYDSAEDASVRTLIEYSPSGIRKETLIYDDRDRLLEKKVYTENEKGQVIQMLEESRKNKNTTSYTYDDAGNVVEQEEIDKNGQVVGTVKRTFDAQKRLLTSEVFINGSGQSISKNYILRHVYND